MLLSRSFPSQEGCTDAHSQFAVLLSPTCAPTAAPNTKNESQSCYVFAPGQAPKPARVIAAAAAAAFTASASSCVTLVPDGAAKSAATANFDFARVRRTTPLAFSCLSITVPLVPARGKQPDSRTESQLQASFRCRNGMPRHKKKARVQCMVGFFTCHTNAC